MAALETPQSYVTSAHVPRECYFSNAPKRQAIRHSGRPQAARAVPRPGWHVPRPQWEHAVMLSPSSVACLASGLPLSVPQSSAPCADQHPALTCLLGTTVPTDMNPTSFRLAMDELDRLYDMPLIAPRIFWRVARQRRTGPAAAAELQAAGGGAGLAASLAAAGANEVTEGASPTGHAPAPSAGASYSAAAAAATRSGFLRWDLPRASAGSSAAIKAAAAAIQTPTSRSLRPAAAQLPQSLQPLQPQLELQPYSAPAPEQITDDGVGRTEVLELLEEDGVHAVGEAGSATAQPTREALMEGPAQTAESQGGEQGSAAVGGSHGRHAVEAGGAKPLDTDPRVFPTLPPRRLATLLLGCAMRGVPLRRTVLQAYVKEVSYRAFELSAEELVSALAGLAKYSFVSRAPVVSSMSYMSSYWSPPLSFSPSSSPSSLSSPSAAAAPAAWVPSFGTRSARPQPSSTSNWADSILAALLTCSRASAESRPAGLAAAAPPAAAPPARHAGNTARGRHSSSSSSGGSGGTSSTNRSADDGPPRVASLPPNRVVQLAHLLVQLDVRPSADWVLGFLRNTCHVVPCMSGGELVRLLELLEALQGTPPAAWWDAVLNAWPPTEAPPTAPPEVSPSWSPIEAFEAQRSGASKVVRTGGSGAAGTAEDHMVEPSGIEVRSAVLYGIVRLGVPDGDPGAAALAVRLPTWAQDALYGMARTALASGHLIWVAAAGAAAAGATPGASRKGSEVAGAAPRGGSSNTTAKVHGALVARGAPADTGGGAGGDAAAGGGGGPAVDSGKPLPLPPPLPARAVAQALAALPAVMPHGAARRWAAAPPGSGGGVLAVLVAALEPRLRELPPRLLVDLLQGLAASKVHPGPRFLALHGLVLKRSSGAVPPRQLLLAAKCYTRLGLLLRGGLRATVVRAREELRREARKAAADHRSGAATAAAAATTLASLSYAVGGTDGDAPVTTQRRQQRLRQ